MKHWPSRPPGHPVRLRIGAPSSTSGRMHLAILVVVIGLSLLGAAAAPTIEWGPPTAANPTPTVKVCHMCEEEVAPTPTATAKAACSSCELAASTRAVEIEATQRAFRQAGTVTAILFWMDGCPDCHRVLDTVLPRVQRDFEQVFSVQLVEVLSQEDVDYLFGIAAALGVPKEEVGVPFLILGEHVLIGSAQVAAELPGLIAHYLAEGGVQTVPPRISASVKTEPQPTVRAEGFGLALAVLLGAVASLAYAGASLAGARLPRVRAQRADRMIPWLAALGVVVSLYLAYVEVAFVQAACGPVGSCNTVQSSAYARLFGVLPLGVLGVLFYLSLLAAWGVARRGAGRTAEALRLYILAAAFAGTAYSAYLTYVEVFVIRAVCLWCLASAVTISIILVLQLSAVRAGSERPETAVP